jgi:hypothetical protein
MIHITVNGKAPETYVPKQKQEMTEEEHQQRIVRSVNRWTGNKVRNHSGARSGRVRIVFHQGVGNA